MLTLTKRLFLMTTIAYLALSSALGAEPEIVIPELKFVDKKEIKPWITGIKGNRESVQPIYGQGTLKPAYMAELFVWNTSQIPDMDSSSRTRSPRPRRVGSPLSPSRTGFQMPSLEFESIMNLSDYQWMTALLGTDAGKSMSQEQKDLLKTGNAICRVGVHGERIGNHDPFGLYAVSQDDARKLTQAFVDVLYEQVRKNRKIVYDTKRMISDFIEEIKQALSAKEKKLQDTTAAFEEVKSEVNFSSTKDAYEKVGEFNNKLGSLEITIAGQKAKLSVIQEYLSNKKISNHETLARLEDMLGTYAIELADTLAQKEAIITLRNRAQLYILQQSLPNDVAQLKGELADWEYKLEYLDEKMSDPAMEPPQIFQNTVTIYPVDPDFRDDSSENGPLGMPASPKENNSSS